MGCAHVVRLSAQGLYPTAMRSSLVLPHICYAMRFSLVLARRHDATLSDLLLDLREWGGCDNVPPLQAQGLYPNAISSLALPHICCGMRSSLVLAHRHDATLSDLLLALSLMMMMMMMMLMMMMVMMMMMTVMMITIIMMMVLMMVAVMMTKMLRIMTGDDHDHDDNSDNDADADADADDDDDDDDVDDIDVDDDDDDDLGITGDMTLESQAGGIWSHKRDIAW